MGSPSCVGVADALVVQGAVIRFTTTSGVGIAWDAGGSGPPLLLVCDGFVSLEAMEEEARFSRCLARLAEFTTLVRFDRRGVGLSDPPPAGRPLHLEDWVDDVVAVVDAVGRGAAWLMASVEMAGLAVLVAARHPERVAGLVLINASARALQAPDYPIGFPPEVVEALLEATLTDSADGDAGMLALNAPSAADDPAFRRWWERTGRRGASPAVARSFLDLVLKGDVRAELPQVQAPTLVLHRKGDQVVPVEHGRYVAEHIPGAQFVQLEGEDDLWWVGDADALLDEVERFVTGSLPAHRDERRHQAVLFTDIVGSTQLLSSLGDRRWGIVLDAHEVLVRRALERHDGTEVQFTGDGVLAVFDTADQAVGCVKTLARGAADLDLRLRAGVHSGPVSRRLSGVAGLTVHIAARVAALAGADEVLCTRTAAEELGGGWVVQSRGEQALRGVDGPWELFSVGAPVVS